MAQSVCQTFEIHSSNICPLDSHMPGSNTNYIESFDHDAGSRKMYQHVQEQEEQVGLDSYQARLAYLPLLKLQLKLMV